MVRVRLGHPPGFTNADRLQHVQHDLAGVGMPSTAELEDLTNLTPHPHRRVQGGHGFLEHHRHAGATQSRHLPVRGAQQFLTTPAHRAADVGVTGQQPHDGQCRHRLAGTGLADEAEPFTGFHGQIDAIDRNSTVSSEIDVQVSHFQQTHRTSRSLGSSRSRNPSPSRLKPNTATAMARAGQIVSAGLENR